MNGKLHTDSGKKATNTHDYYGDPGILTCQMTNLGPVSNYESWIRALEVMIVDDYGYDERFIYRDRHLEDFYVRNPEFRQQPLISATTTLTTSTSISTSIENIAAPQATRDEHTARFKPKPYHLCSPMELRRHRRILWVAIERRMSPSSKQAANEVLFGWERSLVDTYDVVRLLESTIGTSHMTKDV